MNRRRFVQLIAGTVTAIAAPMKAIAAVVDPELPRLLGDGVNDDSPALNALMRGLPVEIGPLVDVSEAGLRDGVFHMPRGLFRMDSPIEIGGGDVAYRVVDWDGSTLYPSGTCTSVFRAVKTDAKFHPITIRNATCSNLAWPPSPPTADLPDWDFRTCSPVVI